jgi:hypothetical protein
MTMIQTTNIATERSGSMDFPEAVFFDDSADGVISINRSCSASAGEKGPCFAMITKGKSMMKKGDRTGIYHTEGVSESLSGEAIAAWDVRLAAVVMCVRCIQGENG